MAAEFDVAGRLAEGIVAVDNTQTYVLACAARGYRHPDLTLHSTQVRDWYGTEDGLDLRSLAADCAALRSAAQSAADALRLVRAQVPALAAAWEGEGGSAAGDFLTRHVERAARVATATESAARAWEQLRDELWRAVDGKVGSTIGIDDRSQQQRSAWLTAARTVMAGGAASEEANTVVDTEITPFADNTIAGDWVPAMRTAVGTIIAAYRAAVDVVAARPAVRFEIPGDLGPRSAPTAGPASAPSPPTAGLTAPERSTAPQFAAAAPSAATAWPDDPLPAAGPVPSAPTSTPPPPASMNPVVPEPNLAPPPPPPPPWAGAPGADPAAGIGALPGRFADALGGLLGAAPAALGDLPGLPETGAAEPLLPPEPGVGEADPPEIPDAEGDAGVDEADEAEEGDETADGDDGSTDAEGEGDLAEAEKSGEEQPPAETPAPDCPDTPAEPAPQEAAEPIVEPPPAAAPVADPLADPLATPCEIAADELPQVGQ